MAFGYEVEKGNVLVIWADDKATPGNVVMETWPDGTKWKDKAEAEAWAAVFIKAASDESAPRPGHGPEQKVIPVSELGVSQEEREAHFEEQQKALAAEAAAEAARLEAIQEEAESLTEKLAAEDAETPKDISELVGAIEVVAAEDAAIEAPKKAKK